MKELKLTINGKEYNFSFGLGFLGELLDELDCEISDLIGLINKNPFKYIPLMMFRSTEFWNKRKQIQIEFSQYDFADDIDADGGINTDNVNEFVKTFTASLTKDVPIPENTPKRTPKSLN